MDNHLTLDSENQLIQNESNHESLGNSSHKKVIDSRTQSKTDSRYFMDKHRYGGTGIDSEDENDPDIKNVTPMTKRKIIEEKDKSKV